MYEDAMAAVTTHLIRKSENEGLIYTQEIIPERDRRGQMFVPSQGVFLHANPSPVLPDSTWRMIPKQDHLVCFFGGSLMLGAVTTGATGPTVSIPPRAKELTSVGQRDWVNGVGLVQTCMETHKTATYAPFCSALSTYSDVPPPTAGSLLRSCTSGCPTIT